MNAPLISLISAIFLSGICSRPVLADDYQVLPDGSDMLLYQHLLALSKEHYATRASEVEKALVSAEKALMRGKRLHRDYKALIGDMPAVKTPLNAQITGTIQCEGYKIEKVVFESRPNHHVTANLYIPTNKKGPFPGVAVPCGHSKTGKSAEVYQAVCILLALNGNVALIYDPICQGERHQLPASGVHGTSAHSALNTSSLLIGRTIVGYEAWDGIRAIDYLLSRSEVSKGHAISVTGNSGGGTQTNYLMALDDRVGAAAPSCYIMTKHRKFETKGSADGCQFLPGEVAHGIDHIDYFWMRAPKPTRILAAEKDFFDINATRVAAAEAKRLYETLQLPAQSDLVSYPGKHSFAKPLREAATWWVQRWTIGDDSAVVEPTVVYQTDAELRVVEKGQVLSAYSNEVTVADFNRARARELEKDRRTFWAEKSKSDCLTEIRSMLALPATLPVGRVINKGTIERDGYQIQKLLIVREHDVPLPALLFLPGEKQARVKQAILYVSGKGKADGAEPGGQIEGLVKKGHVVLSVDLRGYGEMANPGFKNNYLCSHYTVASISIQLGRPLIGQRVGDIIAAADLLLARDGVTDIHLIGRGHAGSAALHAAALDSRINTTTLSHTLSSWITDVVDKPLARQVFDQIIPGALGKYDLPDLVKAAAPRKIEFVDTP